MSVNGPDHKTICPFFHGKDERCARRFNLQCLPQVFAQCLDDYPRCPVYDRLLCSHNPEQSESDIPTAA